MVLLSLTKDVVDAIFNIRYEDIPKSAIQIARFAVLDLVGAAIAGSQTNIGQMYIDLCEDECGGESTVWGAGKLATLDMACFVNSFLAQILDFDDTHEINSLAVGHPGPAILPLALTLGQRKCVTGKTLCKALILGYEMCMRMSMAIEPRDDSFFGFANSQIIGAVTTASILYGLNKNEFINALGLAVSTSPVGNTKAMWSLDNRPMSWIKDGVGFVATTALKCSQMAQRGFQATRAGLDIGNEYYKLCGSPEYKFSKLIENFGDSYLIEKLSFKPYPTCRFMQSTLDTVSKIMSDNNLDQDQISKIQVHITPYLLNSFDERLPKTIIDAQFSLPYAVSMVLSRMEPSPKWYDDSTMGDPSLNVIMDKVELIPDELVEKQRKENSGLKPLVKIILKNDSILLGEAGFAKGHPNCPFCSQDYEEKFLRMLAPYCDQKQISVIRDSILEIDASQNISDIVSNFKLNRN